MHRPTLTCAVAALIVAAGCARPPAENTPTAPDPTTTTIVVATGTPPVPTQPALPGTE